MFSKTSALAVFALASWTHGLLLQIPVDWASSSQVNITWSNDASDQVFALQLFNTDEFHDTFSIANNLQPSADFASFQLGVIPQGTYTLRAISPTNASDIFDETPSFQVAAAPATSSTTSLASTSSSGTTSASSAAGSSTTTIPAGSTSTGFGHTVSNSGSTSTAATSTGTDSTSAASTTTAATNFNGAASLPALGPWMAVAIGAVAGAAALL